MNHKRRRPKSTRAGCLMCKPHKRQGFKRSERDQPSTRRKIQGFQVDNVETAH